MSDKTDINLFWKQKSHNKDINCDNESELDDSVLNKVDGLTAPNIDIPKISIPAENSVYHNENPCTGLAIIFNHEHVMGEKPRNGTNVDRDRLTKGLSLLGFHVIKYNDLTFEEITEVLEEAAQQDYSDYDCFCMTVLSHGEPGKVFAKDMSYPVERLWNPFLGNGCSSLINKPKIFFIQACRGTKLDTGVQYQGLTTMSRGLDVPDSSRLTTFAIPSTADLLVMYSTYEGNYSWRNPINGSWFIQSLCNEIAEFVSSFKPEIDLFHLLTGVCRRVAYEYQSNVPGDEQMDEMKEMPQIVSTLTKIFYLKRKL